tara:strand:- start:891 stop:1244 length:354 start_codon:yes stop_codon:yes gene_type:complete
MKRYFLITDHNRDGEHEYYDKVLVNTKMTDEQLDADYKDWQQNFLAWQFGYVYLEGDSWWSDCRIVSIYDWQEVSKDEAKVLKEYLGNWDLQQIIADGIESFEEEDNRQKLEGGLDD